MAQNEHFEVKRSKRARHSSEHRHKGDQHGHHRGERRSFISGKFNGATRTDFQQAQEVMPVQVDLLELARSARAPGLISAMNSRCQSCTSSIASKGRWLPG